MPGPHSGALGQGGGQGPEKARACGNPLTMVLSGYETPDPAANMGSPPDSWGKASATVCRAMKFWGMIRLKG